MGALLREPIINRGLLRITLSVLRSRLGASVKARTWKVDLSKFAVAVEGLEFKRGNILVTASELRAEFSPLFLLIGRVQLSKVWVSDTEISGSLPPLKANQDPKFHLENELNKLGDLLVELQNNLERKKIGFDTLEISSIKVNTDRLQIKKSDINLENYGTGHVKVEMVVDEIQGEPKIPKISKLLLAAVLFRDREKTYLSIRRLNAELANRDRLHSSFELKGRIPGDFALDAESDLAQLHKWLLAQKNPELVALARKNSFAGLLELQSSGVLQGEGVPQLKVNLKGKALGWNDLSVADLRSEFKIDGKNWVVTKASGKFKATPLDAKANNRFLATNIYLENGKLEGALELDRMGLCSLLWNLGVQECFVDTVVNGKIALGGTMQPRRILPEVRLTLEPGQVFTDPYVGGDLPDPLLKLKAGKINGYAEIRENELDLGNLRVRFGDSTEFKTEGQITFSPARFVLQPSTESADLSEVLDNFLDLPIGGTIKAKATINYDRQKERVERTDLTADYLIKQLEVSGLPLGDVSGTASYIKKILNFLPAARMGPGTLKVDGKIGRVDPTVLGSQMVIHAVANDYEILIPRKSGPAVFDGVINFDSRLSGMLDKNSTSAFGGKLVAKIHSLSTFGIPFERANLESTVSLRGLQINKLEAFKSSGRADLTGFLGSKKSSRLEFSAKNIPVRQLGYLPEFEQLTRAGEIAASGWWSDEKGWAIDAQCIGLKVGSLTFPQVALKFSSKPNDGFFAYAKVEDALSVKYDSSAETFSTHLKDNGIILALAVINKWSAIPEFLKVKGDADVDWSKNQGKINLKSFDLQVTDRLNREDRRLLRLERPAEIIYQDKSFRGDALLASGSSRFVVRSEGESLVGEGRLAVRLFDLIVPDVVRLLDGTTKVTAQWTPGSGKVPKANLTFENTSVFVPSLGTELRDITGKMVIAGTTLSFENVAGSAGNRGQFDLNGFMTLGNGEIKFNSHLRSLPLRIGTQLDLVTSGDMKIEGQDQPYLLTGTAKIEQGLLRKEFADAGLKTAGIEKPWLRFDVPFTVDSAFRVRNSLVDAAVSGTGKLGGSDLRPEVSGTFEVVDGNLFAKDNEFVLAHASVSIPTDAEASRTTISVQASTLKTYQSIDYRIFLNAEGDPQDLKIDFRSEPSLSQKEVAELLTLGYLPEEQQPLTESQGGTIAQSASAEAFQLLFGQALGRGIQKQTGFDVRVGTSADLKQQDTIPKVTVYRRLNDRVSATFGRSLDVSRPENNFKIDYRLLKNLNLTGVWENPEEHRHSLGFDLRMEFDVK